MRIIAWFYAVLLVVDALSVARAGAEQKFSGSEMKLEDAALRYGDVIFIGKAKKISPLSSVPNQPGVSSYKIGVTISRQLTGAPPSDQTITVFTYDIARPNDYRGDLFESTPVVGTSYIFFGSELKGEFTDLKILPATEDNLGALSRLLTSYLGVPQAGRWDKLVGSSLAISDAVAHSDAIFIGKVTSIGIVPRFPVGDAFWPTPRDGVQIKISHVIHGKLEDESTIIACLTVAFHESPLETGITYICFVDENVGASKNLNPPLSFLVRDERRNVVIKLIPSTPDNLAMVRSLTKSP